jgi:hypothetical protein
MKYDFGRCVIERPRTNSSALSRKAKTFGKIVDGEDGLEYYGDTKIPVSRRRAYGWNHKESTDVLGPIKGYLRSSVGKYWDDVYSEICHVFSKGGVAIDHIRYQHIDVATCIEKAPNGYLYEVDKYGDSSRVEGFYVHPDTAKLCWAYKVDYYKKHSRRTKLKHETDRVAIPGTDRWYVKVEGLWFIGTYSKDDTLAFSYYLKRKVDAWPNFTGWRFKVVKSCNRKEKLQAIKLLAAKNNT